MAYRASEDLSCNNFCTFYAFQHLDSMLQQKDQQTNNQPVDQVQMFALRFSVFASSHYDLC